jgi:hypothetical protein
MNAIFSSLLMALNLVDTAVSQCLFDTGDYIEGNPIMAWAFSVIGQHTMLWLVKPALCLALWAILFYRPIRWISRAQIACIAVYTLVMGHHLAILI